MRLLKSLVFVLAYMVAASVVGAATMEEEVTAISQKVCKQLVAKGHKKVAALDFTDLQGRRNELGRFLAEQLTVEMVGAEGISVVDRANLQSVLAEHKLTEEGLVKPENAKKLGEFAGVDAIIIGNISTSETDIVLLVKAISTETAEIIAAGRSKFPKSGDLQQLLAKSIAAGAQPTPGPGASTGTTAVEDASTIASKDVAPLRIAIKGITALSGSSGNIPGVLLSLELINSDLHNTVYVAQQWNRPRNSGESLSRVITKEGRIWKVRDQRGLPEVYGAYGGEAALVKTIQTGQHVDSNNSPSQANEWGGEFVAIPPGKSVRASLTFASVYESDGVSRLGSIQIEAQLIVGVAENETATPKYSLHNIVFDKITLSEAGGPPPTAKK